MAVWDLSWYVVSCFYWFVCGFGLIWCEMVFLLACLVVFLVGLVFDCFCCGVVSCHCYGGLLLICCGCDLPGALGYWCYIWFRLLYLITLYWL